MAKQFPALDERQRAFIARQRIFFTASATADSRVNVSPRSTNALRILGSNEAAYLDLTGSGNETAAHLKADGRMTIMFCAFDGPPNILRLYGRGEALHRNSAAFADVLANSFGNIAPPGTRQIVRLAIDLVQTSCGYAVPAFDFSSERSALDNWAAAKGEDGLEAYRREKNMVSMDGLPTGLFEEEPSA